MTSNTYLYKVCHDVYYKYLHDDIKAPIGCPGLPAYFSPAATNFYFAVNKKDHGDSMEVTSHGFGSGGLSTGLNPETMRINPMYTTMLDLVDQMTHWVKKNPRWARQLEGHSFDSVAGKLYHSFHHLKTRKKTKKKSFW